VAADEGVEREGSALAAVVRSEHDEDVLEEGDEGERPEDEGEDAVDLLVARRVLDVVAGEGALVDVQRRCGHVAVHHPEALVREQQRRAPRLPLPLLRTDRQASNQSGLRTRKKKLGSLPAPGAEERAHTLTFPCAAAAAAAPSPPSRSMCSASMRDACCVHGGKPRPISVREQGNRIAAARPRPRFAL
jgi:hypothetical protein